MRRYRYSELVGLKIASQKTKKFPAVKNNNTFLGSSDAGQDVGEGMKKWPRKKA